MTNRPDGNFQQPPIRPHVSPVPPSGSVPPGGTGRRDVWIGVLLIVALMIIGMLSEEQDDTGDMEASGEEVEVVSSGQGSGFDWRACRYGSAIPFNLPDPSLNRMHSEIIRPDGNFNQNSWTRGVDEFHSSKRYCSPWIHGGEGLWSKVYRAYDAGGIRQLAVGYRCNWSSSRNTYVCNRF